jgi:hypothetical protein
MGIFSFLAPKSSLSGGQASLAQMTGPASMAEAGIQRPQASAGSIKAMDTQTYLASDDKEWLRYLSSAIRTYRKPGLTLKDEHEIWLKARVRN